MVKMDLNSSRRQAEACGDQIKTLKGKLSSARSIIQQVAGLDISGEAADRAKEYASSVMEPLISQVDSMLDTIQHDVEELPKRYVPMVDKNSWSSLRLHLLIAGVSAEINSMESTKANMMSIPGMTQSCLNSMDSSIRSAQKKKNKYKEILEKLERYSTASIAIFSNIPGIVAAVNKGSGEIGNTDSFKKPSRTKLDWEQVKPGSNNFDFAMKHAGKKSTLDKLGAIALSVTDISDKAHTGIKEGAAVNEDQRDFLASDDAYDNGGVTRSMHMGAVRTNKRIGLCKTSTGIIGRAGQIYGNSQDYHARIAEGESKTEAGLRTIISSGAKEKAGEVGADVGASFGAEIGTLIFPGVGTVVGAAVGGIAGSTIAVETTSWITDRDLGE